MNQQCVFVVQCKKHVIRTFYVTIDDVLVFETKFSCVASVVGDAICQQTIRLSADLGSYPF